MVIYFCGCVTVKKTGFRLQAQVVQEKRHKLSSDSLNLNGLPEKVLYPAISLFRDLCSSFTFRRVDSRCSPVSYSRRLLGAAARCVASALSGDSVRIKSSCVLHLCVITEPQSRPQGLSALSFTLRKNSQSQLPQREFLWQIFLHKQS